MLRARQLDAKESAVTKHLPVITLPLFVLLILFHTPGHHKDADKILSDLLISWHLLAPGDILFRLHAEPLIEGVVLWDADQQRVFPIVDQMAHISQQPFLADMKRLENLRDEAAPVATEAKSKTGETYYWCKPNACFAVNGPALAEAMGLKPTEHSKIFQPASFGVIHLIAGLLAATSLVFAIQSIRQESPASPALPEDIEAFDFGPVRVSPARMSATIGTHVSDLTMRDLKLLRLLQQNRGAVLSKDELYNAGWGRDFMPNSRALEQHMLTLRRKLDPSRSNGQIIETVHGQGYRFNG